MASRLGQVLKGRQVQMVRRPTYSALMKANAMAITYIFEKKTTK